MRKALVLMIVLVVGLTVGFIVGQTTGGGCIQQLRSLNNARMQGHPR
jgi:hypothetical protein